MLLFLGTSLVGCKSGQLEPQFAPSTDQPSYAKEHPARLKSAQEDLDNQLTLSQTLTEEFKGYPDQLKDPDWKGVGVVIEDADREGQSPHYADRLEQNAEVASFYEQEKQEIHRHVGGALQYYAKKEGCEAEMYSPAAQALDKSIDKRLEARARQLSDAHDTILLNESSLGKANVAALEQQADHVALASYVTHIGLVKKKNQLDQLLADADAVDATLDDRIEELEKAAADQEDKKQAKLREDELAKLKEAKAALAEELAPAKEQAKTAQQRIEQARKAYAEALSNLEKEIEQRAQAKQP